MKEVAFDLGNIILSVDFAPFIKEWHHQGISLTARAEVFFDDLHAQQDIGTTTVDRCLRERFNLKGYELRRLLQAWNDSIDVSETMAAFLQELKKKDHTIAILSNMGSEHAEVMRRKFPAIFHNNILHLSYEVGARKPTKLYFQSFMMDHPEFKGAAFIDDRPENLVVGDRYGLRGYQFELSKFDTLSDKGKEFELNLLRNHIGGLKKTGCYIV
ncbi:hypothetical protein LCGC14_0479870 [marine sediment metagenome]|uniref:Uncharacterized protein n=1 Tax=marine sediment metagenome TaxID=412755 RepID=A0A0F9UWU4_9ZZZZ